MIHCLTHILDPQLDCQDCEPYFCRDCAELLTIGNSFPGADRCEGCEEIAAEVMA